MLGEEVSRDSESAGVVVGVGGWSALVVADVVGLYELEGSVLKSDIFGGKGV